MAASGPVRRLYELLRQYPVEINIDGTTALWERKTHKHYAGQGLRKYQSYFMAMNKIKSYLPGSTHSSSNVE